MGFLQNCLQNNWGFLVVLILDEFCGLLFLLSDQFRRKLVGFTLPNVFFVLRQDNIIEKRYDSALKGCRKGKSGGRTYALAFRLDKGGEAWATTLSLEASSAAETIRWLSHYRFQRSLRISPYDGEFYKRGFLTRYVRASSSEGRGRSVLSGLGRGGRFRTRICVL